jgi:hypothetical protein
MDKKWLIYAGIFLLGVILAPQARKLPVIGPKIPA